jgi:hypothetical protein
MVETGRTPLLTPPELADLGFTLIVAAHRAVRDGEGGPHRARPSAGEGPLRDDLDRLVTFDGFAEVVDLERHLALGATESVAEPGG